MKRLSFISHSEEKTKEFGKKLAKRLCQNDCLALVGNFGSGKTTFVKGLALGMGVKKKDYVCSPSFVILKIYRGRLPIYHFDLYRLSHLKDFQDIAAADFLEAGGIAVVEWAQRFEKFLPKEHLKIKFFVLGRQKRRMEFFTKSRRLHQCLKRITR